MSERSYLKGYVKALDPSIKTNGKSKSWLRGFIDSYYDNKSKGCSGKSQNSIFGNSCRKNKQVPSACQGNNNYPMDNMQNIGMMNMMSMFNNIINRLLSILQQFSSKNQSDNIYNTYNTTYDNDIINNSINGAGNSIFVDA